jgi:hypothetical protein
MDILGWMGDHYILVTLWLFIICETLVLRRYFDHRPRR